MPRKVGGWKVGDEIHGFANGYFGRDSYACRRVVHMHVSAQGITLVTENTEGVVETITLAEANKIDDPDDRYHCETDEGDVCPLKEN